MERTIDGDGLQCATPTWPPKVGGWAPLELQELVGSDHGTEDFMIAQRYYHIRGEEYMLRHY